MVAEFGFSGRDGRHHLFRYADVERIMTGTIAVALLKVICYVVACIACLDVGSLLWKADDPNARLISLFCLGVAGYMGYMGFVVIVYREGVVIPSLIRNAIVVPLLFIAGGSIAMAYWFRQNDK